MKFKMSLLIMSLVLVSGFNGQAFAKAMDHGSNNKKAASSVQPLDHGSSNKKASSSTQPLDHSGTTSAGAGVMDHGDAADNEAG